MTNAFTLTGDITPAQMVPYAGNPVLLLSGLPEFCWWYECKNVTTAGGVPCLGIVSTDQIDTMRDIAGGTGLLTANDADDRATYVADSEGFACARFEASGTDYYRLTGRNISYAGSSTNWALFRIADAAGTTAHQLFGKVTSATDRLVLFKANSQTNLEVFRGADGFKMSIIEGDWTFAMWAYNDDDNILKMQVNNRYAEEATTATGGNAAQLVIGATGTGLNPSGMDLFMFGGIELDLFAAANEIYRSAVLSHVLFYYGLDYFNPETVSPG